MQQTLTGGFQALMTYVNRWTFVLENETIFARMPPMTKPMTLRQTAAGFKTTYAKPDSKNNCHNNMA